MLIAFVMTVDTSFAQVDALSSIGWRKGVLTSYCEEYDLIPDEGKQWILPWNATREIIKYALVRDGYSIEETDSTLSWKHQNLLKFEIIFNSDSQIKNVGIILIVKSISGVKIAEALKNKLEIIYKEKGKIYANDEKSTSYTWLNTSCDKNIMTMLTNNIVNKDTYIITQYSGRMK